jgi:threonine aldolase
MIGTPDNLPAADFVKKAAEAGVKMISVGPKRVRAVTHRMVTADDITEAVRRLKKALAI